MTNDDLQFAIRFAEAVVAGKAKAVRAPVERQIATLAIALLTVRDCLDRAYAALRKDRA